MNRDKKMVLMEGSQKIRATAKFWRGMIRYSKNDQGLKHVISHTKFLIEQRRIEKKYGLGPGETLGI